MKAHKIVHVIFLIFSLSTYASHAQQLKSPSKQDPISRQTKKRITKAEKLYKKITQTYKEEIALIKNKKNNSKVIVQSVIGKKTKQKLPLVHYDQRLEKNKCAIKKITQKNIPDPKLTHELKSLLDSLSEIHNQLTQSEPYKLQLVEYKSSWSRAKKFVVGFFVSLGVLVIIEWIGQAIIMSNLHRIRSY